MRHALLAQDSQTQMAADDVTGGLIPHERLDQAELAQTRGELAVRGIADLEQPAWVVRCGDQVRDGHQANGDFS